MGGGLSRWMNVWVGKWMDEWIDGWMMDGYMVD
jgi:hypothetical protein